MSRLLTFDTGLMADGDGNLVEELTRPKFAGGGSSNIGRFDAAGRRAVSGCGAGFKSSAGPIPGGGTARAAILAGC